MKKLIILSLVSLFLTNCKNTTKVEDKAVEKENTVATKETKTVLLEEGCYTYNANNNAINLEITGINEEVTGTLSYSLDGKDSNKGTFKGKLTDNKLIGDYTFMSEGAESKREIAFLVKENQLIEGFGKVDETGTAFINKSDIEYKSTMPLTKTDCTNWRANCLFINGKVYSHLLQTCLELTNINIKMNPLKDGAIIPDLPAYLLFDNSKSNVELFLPNANESILMSKKNEGNWSNGEYKLIGWKGYIVQYKGKPIFGSN
jgi:hypothetical protein